MAESRPPREVRMYRAWGAARRFTNGVRDFAFRELVQLIDGGAMHECPPPVLLPDGAQAFQAMITAMDGAREEVLLETYIMRDDRLGEAVQQALIRAASRGVRTYVLADAVGSMNTGDKFWETLVEQGVEVRAGDPVDNVPGKLIVIPEVPEQIRAKDFDIAKMRRSYVRNALAHAGEDYAPTSEDIEFLATDTNSDPTTVEATIAALKEG